MDKTEISLEAKELAKEVIYEIRNEKKDRRLHNTKLLMKNYNKHKSPFRCKNTI